MSTIVKARCHCGLNEFNIAFTTVSLPIVNDLCHCTSCRHSTGQLTVNYAPFDGVPISSATNEPADLTTLTPYRFTESATRWFCKTCSAHILWQYSGAETRWCIAVGTLERVEGIVKTGYHIFVADTLDGGIADYVKVVDGLDLPRYTAEVKEGAVTPLGWKNPEIPRKKQGHDHLSAYCRCNAVSFSITRPTVASAFPSSPYPDLLLPYSSTPQTKIDNPDDEKWWLRPIGAEKPSRYLAGHCACNTCRLTSGFEFQSWAFIPRANILDTSSGSPTELNLTDEKLRPKGLKQYKSSPGRIREFCGTCGATVFWWGSERQDLVDVSVGLIDQDQDGLRAEGWLDWHKDRVSFEEDAVNKILVQAFAQALRE